MDIGKSVQRARKNAGYTSAVSYAKHIGVNLRTYTAYEQNERDLPLDIAVLIADDLGISLDELLGRING